MEAIGAVFMAFVVLLLFFMAYAVTDAMNWQRWSWWNYYDSGDGWRQRRKLAELEDEIDKLRKENRAQVKQPVAQPAKQIIEHRHVHVVVGADASIAAPQSVKLLAEQTGGVIRLDQDAGWQVVNPNNGKLIAQQKAAALISDGRK